MRIIYTLCLMVTCALFCTERIYSQHDHEHNRNEIGINTGALYALGDEKWGSGVHLHYFRTLGDHSRWAIGGFVEQTLFFDSHFSLGAGVRFNVFDKLYLSAMPGIAFTKHKHDHDHYGHESHDHDNKTKTKFSIHGELVYSLFEWKGFHMGPAFDYSWSKGDSHIMLGIHAAVDF